MEGVYSVRLCDEVEASVRWAEYGFTGWKVYTSYRLYEVWLDRAIFRVEVVPVVFVFRERLCWVRFTASLESLM